MGEHVVASLMSASPALSSVGIVTFSSFGCMFIGFCIHRSGMLTDTSCRGVATLYAKVVFPCMVFVGVAAIDFQSIDTMLMLVILAAKATLATIVVAYSAISLSPTHRNAIAHAGAWAMAAPHSFDVTLGVPLLKVPFPKAVAYAYLNQSVQLVLINPVLLVLMESGGDGTTSARLRKAATGVATNPLVVMTVAGLLAGALFPQGLPAPIAALARQVAGAGPFLGFLALGFAMATIGGTTPTDAGSSCVLCAAKLLLMPLLYLGYARLLDCGEDTGLLLFLGGLPASASVYSLLLTRDLSPKVVGPL